MSACKSYKRQIALAAVRALDDRDQSALSEHLKDCPACRAYSAELHAITALYSEDAERSVAVPAGLQIEKAKRPAEAWLPWFKPAFGIAVLVICAAIFLIHRNPSPPPQGPTLGRRVTLSVPSVPTIAASRQLAEKDLDEVLKPDVFRPGQTTEVVFAVRTRQAEN